MRLIARLAYLAPRVLFYPVRLAYEHLVLAIARTSECHGLPIGILSEKGSQALKLKVCEALSLIDAIDAIRFARIRRHLRCIVVARSKAAAYWVTTATCLLPDAMVEQQSIAFIALAIVHEETHARLWNKGVRLWPDQLTRIEAICLREEIRFADRLPRDQYPGTDQLIAYQRERLYNLTSRVVNTH